MFETARTFKWKASPTTLAVTPVTASQPNIRLAPQGTLVTKVTLFPALSNTTFIAIGASNMTVAVGGTPNGAIFQLDAGRSAQVYVDDPERENFDLGNFYACQNDAATTQFLFVTIWQIQG